MGVLGEIPRQTHSSGSASGVDGAGEYDHGPEGELKQSSLQHWQQSCQRSSTPVARVQRTVLLAQKPQWQQKQQKQHQATFRPHQQQQRQQPKRDTSAVSDAFVNAFLSTEDFVNDKSHAAKQGPEMLRALHNTASYLHAVVDQSPAIPNAARALSENVVDTDGRPAVQDPCYLSYSKLARQQQRPIPPSQDFYRVNSPEPFPFAI